MPNPIDPELYPALAWALEPPGPKRVDFFCAACKHYVITLPPKDHVPLQRELILHARRELEEMVEK